MKPKKIQFLSAILTALIATQAFGWFGDLILPASTPCEKLPAYYSQDQLRNFGILGSEFVAGEFSEIYPGGKIGARLGGNKHGVAYILSFESQQIEHVIKLYTVKKFQKEYSENTPKSVLIQNEAASLGVALPVLQHGFLKQPDGAWTRFIVTPRGEGSHTQCNFDSGRNMGQLFGEAGKLSPHDGHANNIVVYNGQLYFIDYDLFDPKMLP
jgi:hypothetical protein